MPKVTIEKFHIQGIWCIRGEAILVTGFKTRESALRFAKARKYEVTN